MSALNQHLQTLIELAYKADPKAADYHTNSLIREVNHHNLNGQGLKELSSILREPEIKR